MILSSLLHQHSWPEDHRIWILPDLPVRLSSHFFFSGRDPALEAIERSNNYRGAPTPNKMNTTLIIYKYIGMYLDDQSFAHLAQDPNTQYLPKAAREKHLDVDKNEYRKNLFRFSKNLLGLADEKAAAEHFQHTMSLLMALTSDMHKAGVPFLLGTDTIASVVPGFATHQEFELLVSAGLSPYEALRTATVNIVAYLGESDKAGTIEVGKQANFIIVSDNPLRDVSHASDVQGVFVNGYWYSKLDLENRLGDIDKILAKSENQ